MDDFDETIADNVYRLISKMDDDEAEMFTRVFADEVHEELVRSNQRYIVKKNNEVIAKSLDLAGRVCDSLIGQGREEEAFAVAVGARYVVEKAQKDYNPYRKADGTFTTKDKNRSGALKRGIKPVERVKRITSGAHARSQDAMRGTAAVLGTDGPLQRPMYKVAHDEGAMWQSIAPEMMRNDLKTQSAAATSSFDRYANTQYAPERSSNDRTWNAMRDAGTLASGVGGAAAAMGIPGGQTVAYAGAASKLAGDLAPNAEKIVGPSVRRAKYRYQGTERRIDGDLTNAITEARKLAFRNVLETAPRRDREQMAIAVAQRKMPIARYLSPSDQENTAVEGAVDYLRKRIPDARRNSLRLASGKVAPSEGIIIDAQGKVRHQSMGVAEDHYLPFSHKNLKALEGGTYIRTRTMGGPTTEDLRTALSTGLKSMVVVSHSGIFQVDMDPDFYGKARSSNRAKQMIDRYGKLLDAVESKQVARSKMSPLEIAEIEEEIEARFPKHLYTKAERENEFKLAMADAEKRPRLTPEEIKAVDTRAREGNDLTTAQGMKDYRVQSRALMNQAMEKKGQRYYKLNGKGYQDALMSLQDEFPYFIQVRNLVQEDDVFERLGMDSEDTGYVKPRFLHPSAEQHGYFGDGIAAPRGTKAKYKGDTTEYQNWRYNGNPQAAEEPREGTQPGAPGQRASEPTPSGSMEEKKVVQQRAAFSIPAEEIRRVDRAAELMYSFASAPGMNMSDYPTVNRYLQYTGNDGKRDFLSNGDNIRLLREEVKANKARWFRNPASREQLEELDLIFNMPITNVDPHAMSNGPSPIFPYRVGPDVRDMFLESGITVGGQKVNLKDQYANIKRTYTDEQALRHESNKIRMSGNLNDAQRVSVALMEMVRSDLANGFDPPGGVKENNTDQEFERITAGFK